MNFAYYSTILGAYCFIGSNCIVNQLLKMKANPNTIGFFRSSNLLLTTKSYGIGKMKHLLKHGADVNQVSCLPFSKKEVQCTAFYRACQKGQEKAVKLLVEHNADVNIKNSEGKTRLEVALGLGGKRIVQFLLQQPNIEATLDMFKGTRFENQTFVKEFFLSKLTKHAE